MKNQMELLLREDKVENRLLLDMNAKAYLASWLRENGYAPAAALKQTADTAALNPETTSGYCYLDNMVKQKDEAI